MSNFFRNIHPLLRRNKRPEKYDDTNFAVLNALNYELTQAEQETIASKIQSSLESATDTYLDTWGDWFGVYRKDGWDDEYYRARIIRELLLKRGTIPAIIDALVDFLNDNDAVVQIYEPWRNIFYTNKSKLNGDDHLMGYYYRFAIIDISIDRPFPPEIVEIIKAFKPAGVLFYLRLDTSLDKNKTTVESPYVYLDVTNKTELEFLNGLYYDLRGNINLSDQRTQVVGNNIFHTNNSKLNGEDVLAGAFNHGRGYIHLASTTLLDYTPKATDSMSNLKTTLGEAGSDMYNQTKEKDGRTASIQVPATKNVHTLYSNSLDFGDYDYSTAPNLMPTLSYKDISTSWTQANSAPIPPSKEQVIDNGDYFTVDLSKVTGNFGLYFNNLPRPQVGKEYTWSVEVMSDEPLANNMFFIRPVYINAGGMLSAYASPINTGATTNMVRHSRKYTNITDVISNSNCQSLQLYFTKELPRTKVYIRYNIMIQEGDQTSSQAPANQMPKITTDDYIFSHQNVTKTGEDGNITSFDNLPTSENSRNIYVRNTDGTKKLIPLLSDKKQYTMSVEMWSEKEVTPTIRYRVNDSNNTPKFPLEIANKKLPAKQWTELSVTGTINLPSNPNIADKSIVFPINSSSYEIYKGNMEEELMIGQTYTITLKGTKVASNLFAAHNNQIILGILNPVAGLTDVWSLTFTPTEINSNASKEIRIFQYRPSIEGASQIEWLKIEKGKTYTPDYPAHWLHIVTPQAYVGAIKIKNDSIKIQEGATTTKPAWKPNLLDAPYYLSKAPLGENLADPTVKFPINANTYKVYEGDMEEDLMIGQTYTITLKGTKVASNLFAAHNNQIILGILNPVAGLTDVWSLTFTPTEIASNEPKKISIFQYQSVVGAAVKIDWLKIEKGNTRTPNIDSYDYVGSLIEDTETPTSDPTKYTWTINGDVTNKKAYMIFDIKTFIEENYATEFEKLVADLGEDQALNAVFENFNISTALKALVSPSSPINFSVELYDFSTSTWHKLNTDSLDLRMRTFNLVANRITDYLNDYKLLFVRYVFDNETDKDATVELDMLNILFNYRLGDGYSLGLQSTVECLSEIPLKGLTLSSESVELGIGETAKVTATPVPANATNKSLEWEIADPKIATVDTSGNITGVAIGETTSTVYGEDRTISATCSVSVKARHTLYSNSIDFGDCDYSGRANLMPSLDFSKLSRTNYTIQTPLPYIKDGGTHFVLDASDASADNTTRNVFIPFLGRLEKGATYVVTIPMMVSEDFGTDYGGSQIFPYNVNDGAITTRTLTMTPNADCRGNWQFIKQAFTVPSDMTDGKFAPFLHVWQNTNQTGKLYIGYDIKIEKVNSTTDTATPYQPNLLDAPYYLSKVALGENIRDKGTIFPINTSEYLVYSGTNTEPYVVGQKYIVSMKATKPAAARFVAFMNGGTIKAGDFVPVEGLTDVWQTEFTVTQDAIDSGVSRKLFIYQFPNEAKGAVQIDWLKIEKGDTRTPNIDSYAYRGTVLTTSEEPPKDPNAYTWSSI